MKNTRDKFWILPGILLLPCLLMAVEPEEFTDFIDGKWYTCYSWVVDAAGDTVYKKNHGRYKDFYKYDSAHRVVHHSSTYGFECFYTYTESGKILEETCDNGFNKKYKYDHLDKLIMATTEKNTTTYDYDGNSKNLIHEKTVDEWSNVIEEIWHEYDFKKNEERRMFKRGLEQIYRKNGTIKYQKNPDGEETWFDNKGYIIKEKDKNGKVEQFENRYDSRGRILYAGYAGYRYLTKSDTSYMCIVGGKN